MAFNKIPPITATTLVGIRVLIFKEFVNNGIDQPQMTQGVQFEAKVLLSNGEVGTVKGNLVPQLTDEEKNWMLDLINRLETKAKTELIG